MRARSKSYTLILFLVISMLCIVSWPASGYQAIPEWVRTDKPEVETPIILAKANLREDKKEATSELQPSTKGKPGIEEAIQRLGGKAPSMIKEWLDQELFWGISWLSLVLSGILVVIVAICDRLIGFLLRLRLRREVASQDRAHSWTTLFLESLSKPLSLSIWIFGAYIAAAPILLSLKAPWDDQILLTVCRKAVEVGAILAIIWFGYRIIWNAEIRVAEWTGIGDRKTNQLLVTILGKSLRIFLLVVGGMIVVQSATEIQLAPLIASLGLGGLAVALAAKDSLANLFGTLTIIFDRAFRSGDHIIIDKYEGTVESVGLRSTRLRTSDGNLVTIPNVTVMKSSLTTIQPKSNIHWTTTIRLAHSTTREKVEQAIRIVARALHEHEGMSNDLPPQVFFSGFDEQSLNLLIQAWYHPADQAKYRPWLERTCLKILSELEAAGIQTAVPERKIYMAKAETDQGSSDHDSRDPSTDS